MLKFHHLRDFSAIGRTSSIRAAAKSLGLAQPAVSKSLAEMERFLGVPLAQRHAQGVVLTPAGERFLQRTNRLLADLEGAVDEVRQLAGGTAGSLHVGLSPALQARLPLLVLPRFRQRWPGVTVRFTECFVRESERLLLDGDLDLYVGPKWGTSLHAGLSAEGVGELARGIVVRAGHALRHSRQLHALAGADWLAAGLHEDSSDELQHFFLEHGLAPPRIVATASSAASITSILLASDCMAILPRQFSGVAGGQGPGQGLCTLPMADEIAAIPIWLIRRTALPLTPAAQFFADLVASALPHDQQGAARPDEDRASLGKP